MAVNVFWVKISSIGRRQLETGTYHSHFSEDSGLFECDTVSIGEIRNHPDLLLECSAIIFTGEAVHFFLGCLNLKMKVSTIL